MSEEAAHDRTGRMPLRNNATHWWPGIWMGLVAIASLAGVTTILKTEAGAPTDIFAVFSMLGLPALVLVALVFIQRLSITPGMRILGVFQVRQYGIGVGALLSAYAITYAVSLGMGLPREAQMTNLGSGLTQLEWFAMATALVVLAPLFEELMFRHFILSMIPYQQGIWMAVVATLFSAVLFTAAHSFAYWPTYALIFVCGLIFTVARIKSDGFLLPITLHASAIVIGLSADYLRVWLEL